MGKKPQMFYPILQNHLKRQLPILYQLLLTLCINTMHKVVSQMSDAGSIPLLQITDAKVHNL